MSDQSQQVETKADMLTGTEQYLEDTETVGKESDARDKSFFVRAVEQGGLPVNIVSVSVEDKYRPIMSASLPNGKHEIECDTISDITRQDVEAYNDESKYVQPERTLNGYFDRERKVAISYFSYDYVPTVLISYETPSGSAYQHSIDHSVGSARRQPYKDLVPIQALLEQVHASSEHETIDDVSPQSPIDALLNPDTDLTDGQLVVNDSATIALSADSIESPAQDTDCAERLEFLAGKEPAYASQKLNRGNWYWGHVSGLYEKSDKDVVLLRIETPLDSAVVPFNINHDLENNKLWKVIDAAGGDLQDARGMDICVRRRAPLAKVLNSVEQSDSAECVGGLNQPIPSIEWDGIRLIDYHESPVEPVAVDANYLWEIGIPPENRFSVEHGTPEQDPDGILSETRDWITNIL